MDEKQMLFALLRAQICGMPVDETVRKACTPEMLEAVYTLAEEHDLAHLVGQTLSKLNLPQCEALEKSKQAAMRALYRHAQQNYEYECICRTLEAAQIPFIPLKGSVLRDYYPEPWMRTSCDIDILVDEQILDRAAGTLAETLGYKIGQKWGHDVSLYAPSGVLLELHYAVIEDTQVVGSQAVLDHFWEAATPREGFHYQHRVSDEMFYFYHIAHMAKHVQVGGCGIRPFLDLWILNHRLEHSKQKRSALLLKGGLQSFAAAAEKVAEHWFSNGSGEDPLLKLFEGYVLDGGVYGSLENSVSMRRVGQSGLQYAMSRVFIDSTSLAYMFPILNKHKWLSPLFQVVRWFKLLFGGRIKRAVVEFEANASVSPDETMSAKDLLSYLGLDQAP